MKLNIEMKELMIFLLGIYGERFYTYFQTLITGSDSINLLFLIVSFYMVHRAGTPSK